MSYITTGGVHYSGIEAEKIASEWLNNQYAAGKDPLKINKSNLKFTHLGTTQYHADVISEDKTITISVKKKVIDKKGKIHGTFDLINTTLDNPEISWIKQNVDVDLLLDIRSKYRSQCGSIKEVTDDIRQEFEEAVNSSFINDEVSPEGMKYIDSLWIKSKYLIVVLYSKENDKPFGICVGESKYLLFYNNVFDYLLCQGHGKSSRTILEKNDKNELNQTGLRMRIVLNNGISALIGLSNANSDSVWTLKIQVDDVAKVLSLMDKYSLD